jgi:hypothetical protein
MFFWKLDLDPHWGKAGSGSALSKNLGALKAQNVGVEAQNGALEGLYALKRIK